MHKIVRNALGLLMGKELGIPTLTKPNLMYTMCETQSGDIGSHTTILVLIVLKFKAQIVIDSLAAKQCHF